MSHILPIWHYVAHKIDDISSLSTVEYIKLVATYTAAVSSKTNFDSTLNSRGYSPEALAEAKKILEKQFNPVTVLGLRFTKPLDNFNSDLLGYTWLLFENYEKGLLPFPGSVSEQPAQIMEIFGVYQALKLDQQEKQNRKMEAEARRQGLLAVDHKLIQRRVN